MTLYDRIRIVREGLGISQTDLAKQCGYKGRQMISQIESGIIDLPVSKLILIAAALNVTPSYLLGDEDYVEQSDALFEASAEIMRLGFKVASLDEFDRIRLEERIDTMLEADKYQEGEK